MIILALRGDGLAGPADAQAGSAVRASTTIIGSDDDVVFACRDRIQQARNNV
jgi:hypothetical protein